MRKLATVLALSLAATHGLPTPRGSIAKKDEAKDDAPRLRGGISKDVDEAVNPGRKPLMGSAVPPIPPPFVGIVTPPFLTCGQDCNWNAEANCEDKLTSGDGCSWYVDGDEPRDWCWDKDFASVNCRKTCGYCSDISGDEGTCGERVDYLLANPLLWETNLGHYPTVDDACAKVAEEYPEECGKCSGTSQRGNFKLNFTAPS